MSESRRRHRWGPRLDRALTPALGLLGRMVGRPDDALLTALTGRQRGGEPAPSAGRAQAALALGRRALERGELAEALLQFQLAHEADPQEPWALHGRGDALQLAGRHADALLAYEAALALAPGLALAHNGRGNALEGLGRRDEAAQAWRSALALDPALPWPREALRRVGAAP